MKRFLQILFFICLISPIQASGSDDQPLLQYLDTAYPGQHRPAAKISATNGNRVMFPDTGAPLKKGQELVIFGQQEDTPLYLLPQIGVLKIDGRVDGAYTARQIANWGRAPEIGDPVAIPSSPVIYLYSNIENRDGFAPYQALLQKLLQNNYEVVEIRSHKFKPLPRKYGVILRLEGVDQSVVTKLESLFSGTTTFSSAQPYEPDFKITAEPGLPIVPSGLEGTGSPAPKVSGIQTGETRKPDSGKDFRKVDEKSETPFFRLPDNFQRLVICQLDNSEEPEFALLNDDKIQIFHRRADGLQPVYAYDFETDDLIGLHLHAMDLTGNGRDELAVTLGRAVNLPEARTTRLNSMILSFEGDRLQPLVNEIPYYLRVITDRSGKQVLLGQKTGEYAPYEGDIFELQLKADASVSATVYGPAADIYSLYQFNLIPDSLDRVMIIEPSGYVSVYHMPSENMEALSDTGFGDFKVIPYPIRLEKPEFRGGFERITDKDHFIPRRFLLKTNFDNQMFTIDKQRQAGWGIKQLKNIFSDQKAEDRLVALKWTGQAIRQTWESEQLPKDILDFAFVAEEESLYLLVRDNQGFALQKIE